MIGKRPPLVTVIATAYNHERFVAECLDSILAQEYPSLQLVIMDDASHDRSVAAIERWISTTGADCEFVAHRENKGICRTRNEALSLARGTYVATVSTDDVWLPGKLKRQVELLEQRPAAAVAYSDALRIDAEGAVVPGTCLGAAGADDHPDGDVYERLLDRNFVPAPTVLVRRSAFDTVGPYDDSLPFEDWDMWLRLARSFEFAFTPATTAKYRLLATSASTTLGESYHQAIVEIQRRQIGQRPEWDAFLARRSALEAYGCRHPNARRYLREAIDIAGWREAGWYYVLATLRISPRVLWRLLPLRTLLVRATRRLAKELRGRAATRLRRRYTQGSLS